MEKLENAEFAKKDWKDMSNTERLESLNRFKRGVVSFAISTNKDNMFWNKSMSAKEIEKTMPYNKANGKPFLGLTGVLLRTFSNANHYKSNEFISLQQAWQLGGELKQRTDVDEKGNAVKKNPPSFRYEYMAEYTMQPKIDPKTQEPMKAISQNGREYVVKERVDFKEPKLETVTLYHISEFKGLDKTKLQDLNLESVREYREKLANQPSKALPNLEKIGIKGLVAETITRFLNMQNKGQDYTPTQALQNLVNKQSQLFQAPLQDKTQNAGIGR